MVVFVRFFFFFFKQKTADEMRISDWSSDVCSSDLVFDAEVELREAAAQRYHAMIAGAGLAEAGVVAPTVEQGSTSVWAQYTIRVPNRALVVAEIDRQSVG